jgi:hypothetical protein
MNPEHAPPHCTDRKRAAKNSKPRATRTQAHGQRAGRPSDGKGAIPSAWVFP